jgi:hypothetical protein
MLTGISARRKRRMREPELLWSLAELADENGASSVSSVQLS